MPKQVKYSVILLLIIAFAVFLRLHNIDKYGLYGDEKYSIMVVNGISWEGATQKEVFQQKYFTPKQFWDALTFSDFDEAIIRTDNGNSSSYYAVLWLWKGIFGSSDFSLRLLNVIFDCLTLLIVFLICFKIFNKPIVGLISTFILSFEPFLIAYSHQVRNYSFGIFLVTLSVFLFLKIIKNYNEGINKNTVYIYYGITILLGILSHFLVISFIFCQFLVFVYLYIRNFSHLKKIVFTYILSFIPLVYWFTLGSGRDTFSSLKGKDQKFLNIVLHPPVPNIFAGWINAPTLKNILDKIGPIFFDFFILTNNFYSYIIGKANFIICLIVSILLYFLIKFYNGLIDVNHKIVAFLGALILVFLPIAFYTINPQYFIYLSIILTLLYLSFEVYFTSKIKLSFLILTVLSIFIPIIVSVLLAFKAGHTANIYQKYHSFGLPICCIITGFVLVNMAKLKLPFLVLFLMILSIQMPNIYNLLQSIYSDTCPKYSIYEVPRSKNPYAAIAEKIIANVAEGDTIIYPSYTVNDVFGKYEEMPEKSNIDAQLTNIYLPKQANYQQKIDANESNKVFLYVYRTGKKELLFDFEGKKYRY